MSNFINELLHNAVVVGDLESVKLLLSAGADVNVGLGRKQETFLHLASDVRIVKELLLHGADVNAKNISGETPILLAVINGKGLPVVKTLLSANADVNRCYNGSTLLHYSSDVEVTRELLLCGADVNVGDPHGYTPLHYAVASREALPKVIMLLRHGAEVNTCDNCGNNALYSAVFSIKIGIFCSKRYDLDYNCYNDMEIVKALLGYGADINLKYISYIGDPYSTPLCVAIRSGYLPLIRMLIKYALLNHSEDYNKIVNLDPFVEEDNFSAMSHYFDVCVLEIVKMKSDNFCSNYHSLFDFVANRTNVNKKPLCCNNEIEIYIPSNYPVYHDIILPRIKEFIERAKLFEKLRDIQICTVTRSSLSDNEVILIPDCIIKIGEYLCKNDLLNFIEAFDGCYASYFK